MQTFENGSNEIEIGTDGADDATLAKNRQIVVDTLAQTFGQPDNGKLDLNNASDGQLAGACATRCRAPACSYPTHQINQLAAAIVAYRDQHGGVLTKIDDLKAVPGLTPQVLNVLNQECYLAPYTAARNIEIVGPR